MLDTIVFFLALFYTVCYTLIIGFDFVCDLINILIEFLNDELTDDDKKQSIQTFSRKQILLYTFILCVLWSYFYYLTH